MEQQAEQITLDRILSACMADIAKQVAQDCLNDQMKLKHEA